MSFRKYNSIELAQRKKFLGAIQNHSCSNDEWLVLEKAHGANFSLVVDGNVRVAKRTSLLSDDGLAIFYNARSVFARYRDVAVQLGKHLGNPCIIYGELIGGSYGDLAKPTSATKLVQRGVSYCPGNEFYAYDVFLTESDTYVPYEDAQCLLRQFGIPCAEILFRGTLDECLAWSKEHVSDRTEIPALFGLESLPGNNREGHVIKPARFGGFLGNGSRPILKDKNGAFAESRPRGKGPPPDLTHLKGIFKDVERFVTEERLDTLLSKEGPSNNIGRLLGLYVRDVLKDWEKEQEKQIVNKKDRRRVSAHITNLARPLLLANY